MIEAVWKDSGLCHSGWSLPSTRIASFQAASFVNTTPYKNSRAVWKELLLETRIWQGADVLLELSAVFDTPDNAFLMSSFEHWVGISDLWPLVNLPHTSPIKVFRYSSSNVWYHLGFSYWSFTFLTPYTKPTAVRTQTVTQAHTYMFNREMRGLNNWPTWPN